MISEVRVTRQQRRRFERVMAKIAASREKEASRKERRTHVQSKHLRALKQVEEQTLRFMEDFPGNFVEGLKK